MNFSVFLSSFFSPETIASPLSLIFLVIIGIVTGTVAGVLGIGGGLLIVPLLTLWRIELVQATATSLVGVAVSAMSGSGRNWIKGELRWRSSLALGFCGLPTAQVGAWVAHRIGDRVLAFSFATFLLTMIFLVAYKKRLGDGSLEFDNMGRSLSVIPIGLLAGFLSGLFGVGGGAVMVPLQMVFLKEPIKSAVRTSLGAIFLIALSGLWRYGIQGNVLWEPGLALAIGGAGGAQIGTRLLQRLTNDRVNQLFRALLIVLAIYMTWRGIRGR
jgi:uncharacterized protein